MSDIPEAWEHINAVQQYVREKIEAQSPGWRVSQIVADLHAKYEQPLHALNEDPDYILTGTVATFRCVLDSKNLIGYIHCTALLGTDGRVEIGGMEAEI